MSWDYKIDDLALRELRKLGPSAASAILDFLDQRIRGCADPRAFGKPLGGDLHGLWRYRVRDYRLLCELHDGLLLVILVKAGHRSTIYND